jgi:hypothetical protein
MKVQLMSRSWVQLCKKYKHFIVGVQVRMGNMEPNTEYVHCAAHNLNLDVSDCDGNVS